MNEYELPIDIHTNKLLGKFKRSTFLKLQTILNLPHSSKKKDWLISRKHCTKNWKLELDRIREKIRAAIKDMPENAKIQLILSKHTFNYFICKQVIEILKETEKHSKNLFGYYSSQRMKDWQDVIQLYEKDGIYLAELASILIRNVTYEVPNLKKTISRMQQLHDEYNRKQDDFLKQSTSLKKEYNQMAESHGLKGANIEKDLRLLFDELPSILANLEKQTTNIEPIKELYLKFIQKINQQDLSNYLPLVSYLLTKGNTTYFEYVNGFKPTEIIEDQLDFKSKNEQKLDNNGDKIDFGDDQIDFGDDDNQIDFGVSDKESKVDSVAKGKDALKILEHFKTRNLILNEFYEIEAFLQQRIVESKSQENFLITSQLEESPDLVDLFNVEFLASKLAIVQQLIILFNQDKIKMLSLLKDNEKYLDTILHKFNHKNQLVERAIKKAKEMKSSADNCVTKIEIIKPQIPILIDTTKEIQSFVS